MKSTKPNTNEPREFKRVLDYLISDNLNVSLCVTSFHDKFRVFFFTSSAASKIPAE